MCFVYACLCMGMYICMTYFHICTFAIVKDEENDVVFPSYCMSIDYKGQLCATHWNWTCVEIMVMAMEMLECMFMEFQWNIGTGKCLTSTCVLIVFWILTFIPLNKLNRKLWLFWCCMGFVVGDLLGSLGRFFKINCWFIVMHVSLSHTFTFPLLPLCLQVICP